MVPIKLTSSEALNFRHEAEDRDGVVKINGRAILPSHTIIRVMYIPISKRRRERAGATSEKYLVDLSLLAGGGLDRSKKFSYFLCSGCSRIVIVHE